MGIWISCKCATFNLDYFKQSWSNIFKNSLQKFSAHHWRFPVGLIIFDHFSQNPPHHGARGHPNCLLPFSVQAPHLPLLQPYHFQWQHSDRKEPARELLLLLHLPFHLLGQPGCLWPKVSCFESGGLAALCVFCRPCQSGMFQSLCKILSPFQSGHCSREEREHGHIWKPIVSQLLHCKWSPGSH